MNRPFAESCLRNQQAIFEVVNAQLAPTARVLELGAGTGQHAAYILNHRPDVFWCASDLPEMLPGITQWLSDLAPGKHHYEVVSLDANLKNQWPAPASYDWVFMANTLHFVDETCVVNMLACAAQSVRSAACGGILIYGPFNRYGQFTSNGNAELDRWLKARNPDSGIKGLEWVEARAGDLGWRIAEVYHMPANNLCLKLLPVSK